LPTIEFKKMLHFALASSLRLTATCLVLSLIGCAPLYKDINMTASFTNPTKYKPDSAIVELRQYTLHPGKRDVLIDLFDREFVETQEAVGMTVMGQFRDLDDPDRFVWLRGFRDMETRAKGLAAFYGGPAWQTHRDVANTTMIDSDNVLLLRPAWPGAEIDVDIRRRAALNTAMPGGLIDASIFYLKEPASPVLLAFCREHMQAVLIAGGAKKLSWYVTESSPNNFPKLPVRENEMVLVGFALFDDVTSFEKFARSGTWDREIARTLSQWLSRAPESHRLTPTARSAIRT
jgi:NIPSNAP